MGISDYKQTRLHLRLRLSCALSLIRSEHMLCDAKIPHKIATLYYYCIKELTIGTVKPVLRDCSKDKKNVVS